MSSKQIKCMRIFTNYILYSDGRLWSDKTQRFLVGGYSSNGYHHYTIDGKTYRTNRLVASYFIPNPCNLSQVDHIDGNKLNNDVSNLQWLSRKDNYEKAYPDLLKACAKVYVFTSPEGVPTSVFGLAGFCKKNGLDQAAMHRVYTGKSKSHKGWTKYE